MILKGIGASSGIAIAKAYLYEVKPLIIPEHQVTHPEVEKEEFEIAIEKTVKDLERIRVKIADEIDEEHAMIFDAHIQIAVDPEIKAQAFGLVDSSSFNIAKAYLQVTDMFIDLFKQMDDPYFKERALDIEDVRKRVLHHFLNVPLPSLSDIDHEVIVVANDLTPSDTSSLNKKYVKGFVTNVGGRTSHSAIMARSLEIPAVVGTKNILETAKNDELLIIDGNEGTVQLSPTDEDVKQAEKQKQAFDENQKLLHRYQNKATMTKDDVHVELAANIGSPNDLEQVLKNGAEGIGLYRTEFLYMSSSTMPSEEEQFEAYKVVLEKMEGKKVVIRTLDIGGDKKLDYLPIPHEDNPFLGHRAIRLCLDRTDIFKTQLRALLRASVYGDLHIMFPMIATIRELDDAVSILHECRKELISEGKQVADVKVGIMVEIPAAAILADKFAKKVDFFSIGTNDLIQYTFAADRMNEKVSYLYQPYNPSLLRLIKMVIDASHKAGIWTGMCGEMAGDQTAVPLLLGLGLDEFSMSASSILQTRHLLAHITKDEMRSLAEQCLYLSTYEEVRDAVNEKLKGVKL